MKVIKHPVVTYYPLVFPVNNIRITNMTLHAWFEQIEIDFPTQNLPIIVMFSLSTLVLLS